MATNEQFLDRLIPYLPQIKKEKVAILAEAKERKVDVIDLLSQISSVDQSAIKQAILSAYSLEAVPEFSIDVMRLTVKYFPLSFANSQKIAVISDSKTEVGIAIAHPEQSELINAIKKKIHKPIKFYFAYPSEITQGLKDKQIDFKQQIENLKTGGLGADIQSLETLRSSSKLLDVILISSLDHNASDIHIEPHEERLLIRFRIDGELQDIALLPIELSDIITSRIKVLAELRIDEHQKPQDGRFKLELSDHSEITTRVSILPVYQGEKIVMRILSEQKQKLQLADLGYSKENQAKIYSNSEKSHGMLLVTGPTGSGKTTTLYTLLKLLNNENVNLMTVEDPIEYRLDRVNQIQVNPVAGLSFANGLRSILRQDPDIVMVGEIRDAETANIAINASLTGHLVLATLHTNSAIDTLPRLLEMGVEAYLVASTVNVVIAQRLIRALCKNCKQTMVIDDKILNALISDDSSFEKELRKDMDQFLPTGSQIYKPTGCNTCNNTGYKGRLAIAEVLEVTDEIKNLIFAKASPPEIQEAASQQGFVRLLEDAIYKIKAGDTSLEEVIRVLKE
ncbi:hypothetical protein COV81_05225 [Candidatus Peregrinibacteria bacterium CG11_big_fil_rev_8_21_14_0_20_41_10]|nr:MAG: hypothetical protein COV81_05225 [Candidatus Peregrinibacteria bacterium CG11_big_fil_rev_8_21_14_0_20_41_10]PIZ74667.1 MAG: hypothetical protein COY06_03820 [Candidatus Peregrinibacteria bacterium CG_4_10_14_0_2_um_filter_41_8]PJC38312.1 MAG: hypothetical protein CO045_00900 [Candidatus Peregrinibacteria bacterium CG_4_9_14_0_2_um_filter_41_14]